jgi:hypothetical protein
MVGVAMILWGFILWVIMIPFFATLFKEDFFHSGFSKFLFIFSLVLWFIG